MADSVDAAGVLEDAFRERALTACLHHSYEEAVVRGYCNDCGDVIAPARLAASPGAVTCIECQKRRERTT